jgi:hypothetical protein
MSVVIDCPNCRTPLSIVPEMAGQTATCPKCRQPLQLAPQRSPPDPPAHRSPIPLGLSAVTIVGSMAAVSLIIGLGAIIGVVSARRSLQEPAMASTAPQVAVANETHARPPTPIRAIQQSPKPSQPAAADPIAQPPPELPPTAPAEAVVISPDPQESESPGAPPPLPTPLNILAALEDAWRLPPLVSTAEEPVGKLSAEPTELLTLEMHSDAAAIPAQASIVAERDATNGDWTVLYVADAPSSAVRVPLATIRLKGTQFSFAWKAALENVEVRRQVSNCWLDVQHAGHLRHVALRPPARQAACRLDLNQDAQLLEFAMNGLPRLDVLRLEIAGLDNFATQPALASQSIAVGKMTKITFNERPGAELEIRFLKLSSGNLAVRLEPTFREANARKFDMTLPRLQAMEAGVTRSLSEDERELAVKKRLLTDLELELRKLNTTTPDSLLEQAAIQQNIKVIKSKLGSTASRVSTLQRQIPLHKARLAAVPGIREFLSGLHQKATIRLRIVAEGGDYDPVLVDAATSASPSANSAN